MREYLVRLRHDGETFTATIREYAPTSHPEVRAVLGPVSRGQGATAPAAMVAAIAAHHIPEIPAIVRESQYEAGR